LNAVFYCGDIRLRHEKGVTSDGFLPARSGRAGEAEQPRVARQRSKLRDKFVDERGSLGSSEVEQRAFVAAEAHVPGALR
jgi:hypothetical protein